jgi:hypothetical protein
MKTRVLTLLLWLPLLAGAEIDRQGYVQLSQTMVRIEAVQPDGTTHVGTGVTLSANRVVTNCHVSGNAWQVYIFKNGLSYRTQLQRVDWKHDICMLRVGSIPGPYASLGQSLNLELGHGVIAIGFSGGYRLLFTGGQVRALYPLDGGNVIRSSAVFNSGASGGGLFTRNGELVGLLTYRLRGGDQQFFAMPVEWFAGLLSSEEGFIELGQTQNDTPLWQVPSPQQPLFMQVAALESAQRWREMILAASRWIVESNSAEAWLARGKAKAALGQLVAARLDEEQAVNIEPRLAEGWMALAQLFRLTGQPDNLAQAKLKLASLDPDLASQLERQLGGAP